MSRLSIDDLGPRLSGMNVISLIANKSKLEKLKRADFGLSVAMWYPHATYEDSIVILYFILWVRSTERLDNPTGTDLDLAFYLG